MTKKIILLIYADQWRHDQFGAKRSYTPHLDALAAEAVSFTQHYTQGIPCAPSRASIYTGLYAQTHRVVKNGVPLDARHTTLGQYMLRAGYTPTLFGYTDTSLDPRTLDQGDPRAVTGHHVLPGFETGCHLPDGRPYDWMAHLRSKGLEFDSIADIFRPDINRLNPTGGACGHPARYAAEDSDTAYLTNRLMGWQREQNEGWCAMLCYSRPHRPTVAPEPYNSLVDPSDLAAPNRASTPKEEANQHLYIAHRLATGRAESLVDPSMSGLVKNIGEADWRSVRAIHLALMAEIDANLGRLFQQLKDTGQWDDTLILFSSDHGEAMMDHHMCNQDSWHDECAHVPLIMRDPTAAGRTAAGTNVAAFSEAVDTIPTLLDWLGSEVPAHLDGASLLPFLHGKRPENWRNHVVWEYHFQDAAIPLGVQPEDCLMSIYRDEKYKHVYMPGQTPVLVDLQNDPQELKNAAARLCDVEQDYLTRQFKHRLRHDDRIFAHY